MYLMASGLLWPLSRHHLAIISPSSHNHLATPPHASQHARRAHDGRVRFVKAKLLVTGEYLMCHVDGFKVSAPDCA